jgi:peptide/nickel transport system permease protein
MTAGGQYLSLTPNLIQLDSILNTPGSGALLGFDDLGRHIDERLIIGARTSFLVSFWVVGLSVLVGTLVGTVTAYLGGWWDRTVGWVGYARLSRAQVLSLKHREHVQAAEALGSGKWFIIRRHLIPLMAAPLIVEATFGIAAVVIAEAGLSFLGLGVQPPEASWGAMIRDGSRYMLVAPHMVLAPGVAIFAVVLSVNLLGDRLRDRLDTRMAVDTGN